MKEQTLLADLRSELDADWSDSTGGYSQFVIDALELGNPEMLGYVEMLAKDRCATKRVRELATRALREVKTDANFLAACGINAEDWGEPT